MEGESFDDGGLSNDSGYSFDAGSPSDAGVASDGGVDADAGSDGGASDDAGGVADSGTPSDAGGVDAGILPDGGSTIDAGLACGTFDGGFHDGGSNETTIVAQLDCSWLPDAGCEVVCNYVAGGECGASNGCYWGSLECCGFTSNSYGPEVVCIGQRFCGAGRRPPSLLPSKSPIGCGPLGAYFAEAARLEKASVAAFRQLSSDLSQHGAPSELVGEARRFARDEVRHARAMGALAGRYGASPVPVRLGDSPGFRSLEEIAIENEVEGCVREAYGALVALWRSLSARDRQVASVLASIAEDECRHATLARKIAAWTNDLLTEAARGRVARARALAL
jgi:hypothetical protein